MPLLMVKLLLHQVGRHMESTGGMVLDVKSAFPDEIRRRQGRVSKLVV